MQINGQSAVNGASANQMMVNTAPLYANAAAKKKTVSPRNTSQGGFPINNPQGGGKVLLM
jgi:hypothetical protein